ncbi:uncharacterized protein FOMMEDRAFT_143085 [Fomitiporia mediterranea MF3/22]|uniref:uncharacterized protein n=1 Tax=Fomitiporia mediterranea (strain MF3/22) TaxID=694068 RepID=UPI0004408275|nr:uncharacterized protein FOMMEDRAFT_143085 [Fomitiporia mediterranea MF3/22]EJC98661.1 hypothetical protein FOMMEDRAFT_143085 [Fomitiporia mediterranea MF3/22]
MAKKTKLKAALSSHQARLAKNLKAKKQLAAGSKPKDLSSGTKDKRRPTNKKRPTNPFQPTDTILLIGEGNFSFAQALLSHPDLQYLPAKNVTATAYDSEQKCYDKYPESHRIVSDLRNRGVELLFSVDATALEKCKALRGKRWNRVVWNFPHAGKGITDQDRNILSNQMILLGFLKSVAPFLAAGRIPSVHARRKKKLRDNDESGNDSDDVDNQGDNEDAISINDVVLDEPPGIADRTSTRGTVLITLRNVPPYTEWNLPKLAKSPPLSQSSSTKPNPQYIQLRSFVFHREDWPGYEHRMTKGERAHGTGTTGKGGEDRTWEFCLKDAN